MKISSYKEVFVNDFNVAVKVEITKVEREGTTVYYYTISSSDSWGFGQETLLYEGSVVSDEDLSFSVLPNQAFEMAVGESVLFRLHPISLARRG